MHNNNIKNNNKEESITISPINVIINRIIQQLIEQLILAFRLLLLSIFVAFIHSLLFIRFCFKIVGQMAIIASKQWLQPYRCLEYQFRGYLLRKRPSTWYSECGVDQVRQQRRLFIWTMRTMVLFSVIKCIQLLIESILWWRGSYRISNDYQINNGLNRNTTNSKSITETEESIFKSLIIDHHWQMILWTAYNHPFNFDDDPYDSYDSEKLCSKIKNNNNNLHDIETKKMLSLSTIMCHLLIILSCLLIYYESEKYYNSSSSLNSFSDSFSTLNAILSLVKKIQCKRLDNNINNLEEQILPSISDDNENKNLIQYSKTNSFRRSSSMIVQNNHMYQMDSLLNNVKNSREPMWLVYQVLQNGDENRFPRSEHSLMKLNFQKAREFLGFILRRYQVLNFGSCKYFILF